MKRALLGSILVSWFVFGCGSSTPPAPVAEQMQPIAGGEPDSVDTNVLGMFSISTGGMCSGTLIAPNLVLTARHCISKIAPDNNGSVLCGVSVFSSPQSASTLYVSPDEHLSQQASWYQGSEIFVPSESNSACGFDVALVILAENMPITPRVPRIDVEPMVDEPYTAVGYGQTDSTMGGARMMLTGLKVMCSGDCSALGGIQSTEFLGDTGICPGDSGGPAIDAAGKVIGVVSRGGQGCTTPIYGSVSAWRDWITPIAKDAAQKGGYETPFWALTGKSDPEPEPPPGTGGAGGGSGTDPNGQSCSQSQACPSGYTCLGDDPTQGHCFQNCSATAPCGSGLTCGAQNVCIPSAPSNGNAASSDGGGCSVTSGPARGPAKPVPWLVGALGLLAGLRWRRR
jgi:MYXO-CTERM domain-containing protein